MWKTLASWFDLASEESLGSGMPLYGPSNLSDLAMVKRNAHLSAEVTELLVADVVMVVVEYFDSKQILNILLILYNRQNN